MPKLIPASVWSTLSLSIAKGDTEGVKQLIEDHHIDVNAFVDSRSWMPVLMEALLSYGFDTEDDRLPLLRYLLEKGANPNIRCNRGYNCLHIAVQQEKYRKALDLFLDFNADVNIGDEDGSNVIYWAVQGWLLRKNDEHRAEHLHILGKILWRGADLDQENRFGMTARRWLEYAAPDVRKLVADWEAGRPTIHPATTVQPVFPTELQDPELAYRIWSNLVPATGPAATVQGELLRSVERLRDEAQQNGNENYRRDHRRMAVFVRDTLVRSGIFDQGEIARIQNGTQLLMKARRPYTKNDVFDHLVDQVCVFYNRYPEPIPYKARRPVW
ncbi:MAG TPA: ankyrin repeat domain-containing protein [Puia sp.]|nr:ankyrin repeat domain-containing protein [Puia sp.]